MAETPSVPPTSSRACPSCGRAIDPLRAGEVAILEGQFLYFCDRNCKRAYVDSSGVDSALDRFTADPPVVTRSNGVHVIPAPEPSWPDLPEPRPVARSRAETDPDRASAEDVVVPPRSVPRVAVRQSGAKRVDTEEDEEDDPAGREENGHGHEPEPEPEHEPVNVDGHGLGADHRKTLWDTIRGKRDLMAFAGVGLGVLSWLVALAGTSADPIREPLAMVAVVAWILRVVTGKRDAALVHPAIVAAPPLVAMAAAIWAARIQSDSAEALASFAGLCAAASLFISYHVDRALEPLVRTREEIADALEVPVRVVRGGIPQEVMPSQVKPGEQVLVESGEVLGVDGIVAAGEATVVPWLFAPAEATKKEGDAVVAGTRIVTGSLRLITTWAAHERAWAKLTLLAAQRIDVAAPTARATRLALERGAPLAAVVAAAVSLGLLGRGPDALSVMAGTGMALCAWGAGAVVAFHHARGQAEALAHGIVYKDAHAFHDAGTADIAVVCARGTVLMGEPEIVLLEPLGALEENRVLALAAGAETASSHPLASAILRAARARGIRIENVRNATEHAGLGVTALSANGERMVVGSRALLLDERISVALADARVSQLESEGRSVLLVALGDKLVGLLALQDGLRAGARAAVQRLHDARIEPVLLSGEARDTCETIGRALDIDHIRPEVLPADRGAEVRALREGGHAVAVLGHPQTDDVALGAADVSVALCSAGSTPGEWTVALASDDVRHAAQALGLSRICRERTRVALIWGIVPGVLATLGMVLGVAPLLVAPAAALLATMGALAHARR